MLVKFADVPQRAQNDQPWKVYLECTEGNHNKYYQAEGCGIRDDVVVSYGRIGHRPQRKTYGFYDAWSKLGAKITGAGSKAPYRDATPPGALPIEGPFGEIRKVVRAEYDVWDAFNANDSLVMQLTDEGCRQLLELNPKVEAVADPSALW